MPARPDGSPIRVGVVGIGFGQAVHVPALRACPDFEVSGICATRAERAAEIAGRLGIPKSYGSWTQLVEDPEIDAVTIATPPGYQEEIAIAALERGKPVFCEKPIALDVAGARRMVEAAERAAVPHLIDFELLEVDAFRCLLGVLEAGTIGTLRHVSDTWHVETYATRMQLSSWKTCAADGGGMLSNFVSHSFSYLEEMCGPISRLAAHLSSAPDLKEIEGETFVSLQIEFDSGAAGSLVATSDSCHGSGHQIEVYGSEGSVRLEQRRPGNVSGHAVLLGRRESESVVELASPTPPPPAGVDDRIEPVSRLLGRFAAWIRTGESSGPTLREGLRSQQLVDLAKLSAGGRSWVDTEPDSRL